MGTFMTKTHQQDAARALSKGVSVAVALTFSLMAPTHAATVTIDDFDTTGFQAVGAPSASTPSLNPSTSVFATADAIGGVRTITVERTSPMGTTNSFGQQAVSYTHLTLPTKA